MGRSNERVDTSVIRIIEAARAAGVQKLKITSDKIQIELDFGSDLAETVPIAPQARDAVVKALTPEQLTNISIIRKQEALDNLMMLDPAEYEEKISRGELIDG